MRYRTNYTRVLPNDVAMISLTIHNCLFSKTFEINILLVKMDVFFHNLFTQGNQSRKYSKQLQLLSYLIYILNSQDNVAVQKIRYKYYIVAKVLSKEIRQFSTLYMKNRSKIRQIGTLYGSFNLTDVQNLPRTGHLSCYNINYKHCFTKSSQSFR